MTETPLPGATEPEYSVTDALDIDYYSLFTQIPEADRELWERAREVGTGLQERMAAAWDAHEYPLEAVAALGAADLFVDGLEHPLLSEMSPLGAGLVNMELSRIDGSLGTIVAVQGGLALRSLILHGSPEQQQRWAKPLASGEVFGAFALTEPDHGSDSAQLETVAERTAEGWTLRGAKKWIGNGAAGGITIVWARDTEDGQVKGFVVEQSTPGYEAEVITGKGALRAIHQAEITLTDVRVGDDARLPGVATFKDAARVLVATRVNVGWSALGHATAMFEVALAYARQREQFGKPLGAHQMVQERLAQMLDEVTAMQTRCVAVARLQAAGRLRDEQASLLKYACTRGARRVAQIARDMLGGNGILLEHRVMRHFADVEALHTYEGTESVQALILGRDLTGMSAFA